jgi:hypothetical protein
VPAKTSIIKSLKKKVVEFGHKLDRGTQEYVENKASFQRAVEESRKVRREYKAYEKAYGRSAMDKITRAETIRYYPDKLKNIKFKKKNVIFY